MHQCIIDTCNNTQCINAYMHQCIGLYKYNTWIFAVPIHGVLTRWGLLSTSSVIIKCTSVHIHASVQKCTDAMLAMADSIASGSWCKIEGHHIYKLWLWVTKNCHNFKTERF